MIRLYNDKGKLTDEGRKASNILDDTIRSIIIPLLDKHPRVEVEHLLAQTVGFQACFEQLHRDFNILEADQEINRARRKRHKRKERLLELDDEILLAKRECRSPADIAVLKAEHERITNGGDL